MKKILFIALTLLFINEGNTQSLLHSKPLDLNAGFAGSKKHDRISFHFNEISSNSQNSYFSYDRLVKQLKGGIGILVNRKKITTDFPNSKQTAEELQRVGVVYSPKIIIKNSILISPSVGVNYAKYIVEVKRKIDEVNGLLILEDNHNYIENSVGVLVNITIGYLGYQYKSQFGNVNYYIHNIQAGYVNKIASNRNILFDGVYRFGIGLDNNWRNYENQVNIAYNQGVLYVGAGLNDSKYVSALFGVKLINLKLTTAYHVIKPNDMSNIEAGIQYIFDKNNDEKLITPFRKWMIQMKM